ncbi:MAG: flagellar hook-length control protein FliK [Hyphomonadaceae bacterium]
MSVDAARSVVESTTPPAQAAAPAAGDGALFAMLLAHQGAAPQTNTSSAPAVVNANAPPGLLALQSFAAPAQAAAPTQQPGTQTPDAPLTAEGAPAPLLKEAAQGPIGDTQTTPAVNTPAAHAPAKPAVAAPPPAAAPQAQADAPAHAAQSAAAAPTQPTEDSPSAEAAAPQQQQAQGDAPATPGAALVAMQTAPPPATPMHQPHAAAAAADGENDPIVFAPGAGKKGAGPAAGAPNAGKTATPGAGVNDKSAMAANAVGGDATAHSSDSAAQPGALAAPAAPAAAAPAHAAADALPRGAHVANPAAAGLAQQIARRFDGGATQFEVRLDPAELGRVDVRITVDKDKRVSASVAADNPQTLAELRHNARELERALSDSGLDLAENGLSFDLSGQRQDFAGAAPQRQANPGGEAASETTSALPVAAQPFGMTRWSSARVDVWA